MKYLHENADAIISFVESQGLRLFRLDIRGQKLPYLWEAKKLHSYCRYTQRLWGVFPNSYFIATHKPLSEAIQIHAAIEQAESSEEPLTLVIVGYVDGGLISISDREYAFQSTAQIASWWKPIDISKPAVSFSRIRQLATNLFKRHFRN